MRSIIATAAGLILGVSIATHGATVSTEPTAPVSKVSVKAPKWAPSEYKPCKEEDSRGCYWDAGKAGNGVGCSFWTDKADRVHYITKKCRES